MAALAGGQHWREQPSFFCKVQAGFYPLKKCSIPLSCCLALERGCGQHWNFLSPLYVFGSGFSDGEAAREQGGCSGS